MIEDDPSLGREDYGPLDPESDDPTYERDWYVD